MSDLICPKNAVRFLAYPYHVCAFVEDTVVDVGKCQDEKKAYSIPDLLKTITKQQQLQKCGKCYNTEAGTECVID